MIINQTYGGRGFRARLFFFLFLVIKSVSKCVYVCKMVFMVDFEKYFIFFGYKIDSEKRLYMRDEKSFFIIQYRVKTRKHCAGSR
jgi:hypothetical protein